MTDIEIAQKTKLSHIKDIAKKINLLDSEIEYYGQYKAKVDLELSNKYTYSYIISTINTAINTKDT